MLLRWLAIKIVSYIDWFKNIGGANLPYLSVKTNFKSLFLLKLLSESKIILL